MALKLAASALAVASAVDLKWTDCGDSSTHAKVTDLSPLSVPLGKTTTLTGTATLDSDQSGGSFAFKAKLGPVPVLSGSGSLCEDTTIKLPLGAGSIKFHNVNCPVAAGTIQVVLDVDLGAGSGDESNSLINIDLTGTTDSGDKLLCMNIQTQSAASEFETMAAHINSLETTWKAEAPTRFNSVDDVKMLLGTIMKGDERYVEANEEKADDGFDVKDIPAEFDVRTAFPACANVSGHIRDQSACGSCWAFGSTEAFNDRRCIATGDTTLLSVEDTTANCGFLHCFSMGCNGGQPGQAWSWFAGTGVVTGGDYFDIGKGDTCAPYSLAPCAHHVPATAKYPACPSDEYSTPSLKSCSEGSYASDYNSDKKKAANSYSLGSVAKIQADIAQYGSATGAFTVYSDFPTYKSGVYKHTSGDELGGHAIKIMGWGTENGEDYWLVANSWNEEWGDHGTFKIARGNDECGIESQVSAGTVDNTVTV